MNNDVAIKHRQYGGPYGIVNSSLGKYLIVSKILRLQTILHDAAGFIREVYNTGPTYYYMLPWKCNNSLIGCLSGITFCCNVKLTKSIVRTLKERLVVLDLEGFRCSKKSFIVKEVAITTSDYGDSLNFLPPASFNSLPKFEQEAYNWLTNNLHGIHWKRGDYSYLNFNQIIQNVVLRNPKAVFYVQGKDKTDLLAKYLDRKIVNLDELVCPRIENLRFKNYPASNGHLHKNHFRNHCDLKKSKAFFYWLKNEQQRETSESGNIPISQFSVMCLVESRE